MPITADHSGGKNYTLGRGRVYFSRFTEAQIAAGLTSSSQGEGERYLGNTPSFRLSSSEEVLDHFDSDEGVKTKDASVSLQLDRTGGFTCDNIQGPNLALLFLSSAGEQTVTQLTGTAVTYVVTVKRNHTYQIGQTSSLPTGVRGVSNVVVAKGVGFGTNVAAANNWQVDEDLGRLLVLDNAPDIPDGTEIQITYDRAANTRKQVISGSKAIYGQLHFISANPTGPKKDYFMPYVKLAPDGDYELKGDAWQEMSFNMEALKLGSLEAFYIDGRAA